LRRAAPQVRGAALGDGRVYLGQLDGRLVALDQRTGKVAWRHQVMPWQKGYSATPSTAGPRAGPG
jgi:outer membrane protein assembly factor BamB